MADPRHVPVAGPEVGGQCCRNFRAFGESSPQSLGDDPDLFQDGELCVDQDDALAADAAKAPLPSHLEREWLDPDLDVDPGRKTP
jgi:hypothetical protein